MKNYLHSILLAAIIVLAILLQAVDSVEQTLFRYDREAVFSGEYWRLLSAHFTHLGWSHLFLNMVVFIPFWFLFKGVFKFQHWLIIIVVCSIGISICFAFFDLILERYVGFSGVLHGLFMAVALKNILQYKRSSPATIPWEAIVIFLGIIAKITYEQIVGAVPMTQKASGGIVIVNAHLYGTILGAFLAVSLTLLGRKSKEHVD